MHYGTNLIYDTGTMLPHAVHDFQSCTTSLRAVRLRCDGERVDQSLRVVSPNLCQQRIDIPANVLVRGLDTRDDLFVHLVSVQSLLTVGLLT